MSIAQEITRIKNCKTLIREAIVEKGVAVPENDLLDKYPDYIKEIKAGGSDVKLQEKTVTIIENGQQIITPDEGYALSGVTVNAAVMGEASGLDFSVIGYSVEDSARINAELNADINYTKSLMPIVFSNQTFLNNTQLKYAPAPASVSSCVQLFKGCTNLTSMPQFDTSNRTNMDSMFYGCVGLKTVPQFDTSNVTYMYRMFEGCTNLKTVPQFDTSKVYNMEYMFDGCSSLTSVPQFNTSNVTVMKYMFYGCVGLKTVPQFDTSNVTTMNNMFANCSSLTSIPQFDTSKVTNMSYMFSNCNSLAEIPELDCGSINTKNYYPLYNNTLITDLGGFIGMKMSWDNTYGLSKCPNLTYQSCINVLNGLYDFTGNGKTPNSNQGTLKVHANFLAAVGAEISIGTNKGWTITA